MNCPVDGTVLQMTERQGVEVDYCPQCRGVWLDRGELDKILDRAADVAPLPTMRTDRDRDVYRAGDVYRTDVDSERGAPGHHKRRKKSFLSEMLDFD
ncbi:MAG: zf-TFIIB domain-containing protein [Actinomycetota bacterium]|nr:zf-TFIIB domain-containing protein [Actinomycetota bacterium]